MSFDDYPDVSEIHNNLGVVYDYLGRYDESVQEYKEALRTEPTLMIAYNGMITVYVKVGQIDSALVWLRRQLEYDPQSVWPYDNLGWAYLAVDSLEEAAAAFERALEFDPDYTMDLFRLGHTYRLLGRHQKTMELFQKVLNITPNDPWAHYHVGIVYGLLGAEGKARDHFERFRQAAAEWVQQDSTNAINRISLGYAYTRLGQKERGWDLGQEAMAIDSTIHFEYALLLSLHGNVQGAIDQLELEAENGSLNFIWAKIHPDLVPLFDEPRFKNLMDQIVNK
jgi:pentatricopeptide repeat protein